MNGKDEPRGGRQEAAGENHVPQVDAHGLELRLAQTESDHERGNDQSKGGEGSHGDIGGGEFTRGGKKKSKGEK